MSTKRRTQTVKTPKREKPPPPPGQIELVGVKFPFVPVAGPVKKR